MNALALDLRILPRPNRHEGTKSIPLKQTSISNQRTKLIVLITAITWGLNHPSLAYKNRIRIARAAFRLVAYDNGFLSEFSVSSILQWDKEVIEQVKEGLSTNIITTNTPHVPTKYVDTIDDNHPGYLHSLYRKAINLKGPKASFLQLSVAMNSIGSVASELRPSLTLHRLQLNRWFCSNGGTRISRLEKPLNSEKCKLLRRE